VGEREVVFRWEVTPRTELYTRTEFTLTFPAELDPRLVPQALWWRIALIFFHTQWVLLRPCRVELPVRLDDGEREFWLRLTETVKVQLEAYGSRPRPGPAVQLIDLGPPLEPVHLNGSGDRAALAFSGGKDSLTLAALLSELTDRPLLVTTTSPVNWARDHVGEARARTLREVARRLPVETIEVRSDFRTCWELAFSSRDGCRLGVHELSDLPLYQGVTAAVAAARGVGRAFMATEAEQQYNIERDGKLVLHREFLSSAVIQSALDAFLHRCGLRQGSLTYGLHMPHVQALLLRRYPELASLQFSCWQASAGRQACSVCGKCLQIALVTMAEGLSPSAVGIEPVRTLYASAQRRLDAPRPDAGPVLHAVRTPIDHGVRLLQKVPTDRVASILRADPEARQDPRLGEALAVYARLRANALGVDVPEAPGYIGEMFEFVHSDLRRPLQAIFDQYFTPAPDDEFAGMAARARGLAGWISEPLQKASPGPVPRGDPVGTRGRRRARSVRRR
jgi:hypothetical protein